MQIFCTCEKNLTDCYKYLQHRRRKYLKKTTYRPLGFPNLRATMTIMSRNSSAAIELVATIVIKVVLSRPAICRKKSEKCHMGCFFREIFVKASNM